VKQLEQARRICPIVSVQNEYNIEDRSSEAVLKACEKAGIAFLPWYPLGAGAALRSSRVKKVAARLGATPSQIALAWLLAKSPVMPAHSGHRVDRASRRKRRRGARRAFGGRSGDPRMMRAYRLALTRCMNFGASSASRASLIRPLRVM
jgi:hypothetical protein